MTSRNTDMQAIFSKLSEKNKDIVILVAKSVKVAQDATAEPRKPPVNRPAIMVSFTNFPLMYRTLLK